jgi:hypothetical protein
MNPLLSDYSSLSQIPPALLALVLIWSLIWKGLALWKSSQKGSKVWFIVLLVVNTVGLLEILYMFLFSKMSVNRREIKVESSRNKVKKKRR